MLNNNELPFCFCKDTILQGHYPCNSVKVWSMELLPLLTTIVEETVKAFVLFATLVDWGTCDIFIYM